MLGVAQVPAGKVAGKIPRGVITPGVTGSLRLLKKGREFGNKVVRAPNPYIVPPEGRFMHRAPSIRPASSLAIFDGRRSSGLAKMSAGAWTFETTSRASCAMQATISQAKSSADCEP
ncbi:hypothetical protein HAP47_0033910 [Bradyrhizobium sp. 41S5]|uniref:hypothetical protein n=1 Tax=Bradyrhizobium sp. 41S5 TaxID=1404443 RepID=UPI00156AC770|nr:hypothetical protein [Bradyrhizobium sp. 41S5]UFX44142.1 hypothetical protein HAP47_0033910 [Bradyrhizobium sp. 41S5]